MQTINITSDQEKEFEKEQAQLDAILKKRNTNQ